MGPEGESLRKKMIGKPYSGKLNVRFDEGELEIEHSPLRQLSTLPEFPILLHLLKKKQIVR
jgi:hypothetical protein